MHLSMGWPVRPDMASAAAIAGAGNWNAWNNECAVDGVLGLVRAPALLTPSRPLSSGPAHVDERAHAPRLFARFNARHINRANEKERAARPLCALTHRRKNLPPRTRI